MVPENITVMGGGNTAFAVAATLAQAGSSVLIWEHPSLAGSVAAIQASSTIYLEGTERAGPARLAGVTTDIAAALGFADVVLMAVPAYAHRVFGEAVAPHLHDDQLLVLLPGTLGSLEVGLLAYHAGRRGAILAEVDTSPFVCRKTGPDRVAVLGTVAGLGVGVFPSRRTAEVLAIIRACFPGTTAYPNVLAAGLSSLNPLMHPAGVLMNAGRIERSRGDFYFYDEGVTPSVVAVIEAVDSERLAIGRALDLELLPVAEGFYNAGFGPAGDLWSVINGSQMLTALRAPGSIHSRWLTEDVPYGLVTWASLAEQLDVPTPHIDSLITLISTVLRTDCRATGRTMAHLGLADLTADEINLVLEQGWRT